MNQSQILPTGPLTSTCIQHGTNQLVWDKTIPRWASYHSFTYSSIHLSIYPSIYWTNKYLLSACYEPDSVLSAWDWESPMCSHGRLIHVEGVDFNNNTSKYAITNWEMCPGEKKHHSIGAFTKYPSRLGMSKTLEVAWETVSSVFFLAGKVLILLRNVPLHVTQRERSYSDLKCKSIPTNMIPFSS